MVVIFFLSLSNSCKDSAQKNKDSAQIITEQEKDVKLVTLGEGWVLRPVASFLGGAEGGF